MERKISLYYNDLEVGGRSNKEYHVQIAKAKSAEAKGIDGYVVNFQFGPRGGTLQTGTKTPFQVSLAEAERIYDRLVAEKTGKGYKPEGEYACAGSTTLTRPQRASRTPFPVELLEEIEEREAEAFIKSTRYWMQLKYDGHRIQISKNPSGIVAYNKKGEAKSLPSEVHDELMRLFPGDSFFLDGELISNTYVAFDLLTLNGESIWQYEYKDRWERLLIALGPPKLRNFVEASTTWKTPQQKRNGVEDAKANHSEGVVFKYIEAPYQAGKSTQHKKFKFIKSASCKVIAVRVGSKDNAAVALLDGGRWVEVAHVSTIGKGPVKVGDIVEVKFLMATEARRLREPRIDCVRTDVDESECTMTQLAKLFKQGVAA